MSESAPALAKKRSAGESLAIAVVAFIGMAVYLGIAVAAWGGPAAFFSNPAFVALVAVTVLLTVVSLFTDANLSTGLREDRDNRWVIPALMLLAFLSAWLAPFTDRRGLWTIGGDDARWTGVVLYATGGLLRLIPVFVLGRRFSGLVAIQPGHALVTDGIYKVVRNPSYLGLLVNSAGWALAFRSGAGLAVTALMLVPLVARMHSEERLLRSQFGPRYEEYCARTWRLVPGIY
jgi:protein-S-isoprenylcysteine O-methyltransferase Ste14